MKNRHSACPVILYGGIFLVSTCLNSLAPLMVEFQRVFTVDMSWSALIPASQSCGTILSNLTATFHLGHIGTRRATYAGILLNIAGLTALLVSSSLTILCLGVFLVGGSFALTLTTFSTIMGHLPEHMQRFSRLHAFFGLGGLTAPLLVNIAVRMGLGYHVVFAWELSAALLYLTILFMSKPVPDHQFERVPERTSPVQRQPILALVLILLAFYSVSEMSLVIWCGNSFQQELGWTVDTSALLLSGFWILFTVGRFFGDFLIHTWRTGRLIRIACLAALLTLGLFIWGPPMTMPVMFLLTALAMSTIFPAIHFMVNQNVQPADRASLNASLFLTVSSAGLIGIPLIGIVADWSMTAGLSLLMIPYLFILVFMPRLLRRLIPVKAVDAVNPLC